MLLMLQQVLEESIKRAVPVRIIQTSYPTKRPDGTTNLGASDDGRLLIISTDGHLEYWDGTGFVKVVTASASQLADGLITVAKVANHFSTHLVGYAKLIDSQVNGTDGGTATSGSWFKRVLNTVVNDSEEIIIDLTSSVMTLDAGDYRFRASVPGRKVNRHQCRFRDTTNASTVEFGTSEYAPSADNTQNRSEVSGEFTVADDSTTFELQHRVETTRATDGLGVGVSFDGAETFAVLEIWKMT
jgi:hypothetical protein